ncbi:MAG TPA: YqhA family protein, partial [Acidimicrobiales bacterium]|nr:YqhA family protein [Acidimicrobiales bacterium]
EGRRAPDLERILAGTRYLIAIPVVLLLLVAVGAFVYGVVLFVDSVRHVVAHPFPVRENVGYFVLLVDVSLVGATTLIGALGFYELFLARDDVEDRRGVLPGWLVMRDLNDLKLRVISMVVLVAAVSFTEVLVDFQSGVDVLYLGAGVALVIGALTVFTRFGVRDHD